MRNELGRIKTFLPTNELVEDERNEDLRKESMELSCSVKGDLLEKKDVCSYAFNNTGERYSYLIPHTVSLCNDSLITLLKYFDELSFVSAKLKKRGFSLSFCRNLQLIFLEMFNCFHIVTKMYHLSF